MTDAAELLALVERVETAEGPSRHLDTQVFILLDPNAEHIVGTEPGRFPQKPIYGPRSTFWEWACDETKEPPQFARIPAYTASLDAAFGLMPDGHKWAVYGGGFATVERWDCTEPEEECGSTEKRCATPALALTAACLRARAAEPQP